MMIHSMDIIRVCAESKGINISQIVCHCCETQKHCIRQGTHVKQTTQTWTNRGSLHWNSCNNSTGSFVTQRVAEGPRAFTANIIKGSGSPFIWTTPWNSQGKIIGALNQF